MERSTAASVAAPRSFESIRQAVGDDSRREALRNTLLAFFSSRLLIWIVGVAVAYIVGLPARGLVHDPHLLTHPFGTRIANDLVAPAARFDSSWFLSIAKYNYIQPLQTVFYPLYPASIALLGLTGIPLVIAGILISCGSALGALYLLHRLVELDFGPTIARNTVWIVAWLPFALFLSAVYSESLFLLLTVASLYSGRLGRWWLAGILGALAAATRNSGILMMVPLLILYLYGPRADREPELPANGLRPRYRLRADVLWIALVPVGLLAYLVYLHFQTGHWLTPFRKEKHWLRSFEPLAGIPLGIYACLKDLYNTIPGVNPKFLRHLHTLRVIRHFVELAVFALACWLIWFGRRRIPIAYTALAIVSLAMTASVPAKGEPLRSLPRFSLVIFPLWIALGIWATDKGRVRAVIAVCAPLIAVWTYWFTGWLWAA